MRACACASVLDLEAYVVACARFTEWIRISSSLV